MFILTEFLFPWEYLW